MGMYKNFVVIMYNVYLCFIEDYPKNHSHAKRTREYFDITRIYHMLIYSSIWKQKHECHFIIEFVQLLITLRSVIGRQFIGRCFIHSSTKFYFIASFGAYLG